MQSKSNDILNTLEQGVKNVFNSDRYLEYLTFLSKFHNYSWRNTVLIFSQNPEATLVAGFNDWKNKHNRYVKKGEKAIRIIAPYFKKIETETPVLDNNGKTVVINGKALTEKKEIEKMMFRAVSVFDVSQTDGEPIPQLTHELQDTVKNYQELFTAISSFSKYPIEFEDMSGDTKGYFSFIEQRIAINNGMSESHTIKTAIHELTHSRLHNPDLNQDEQNKVSRANAEVQAESVAFVVANYFGIDTSDYSFDYIAAWSSGKELDELHQSLEVIQKEANIIIQGIEEQYKQLLKDRNVEAEVNNADKGFDRDMDGVDDSRDSSYTAPTKEQAIIDNLHSFISQHKEKISNSPQEHKTTVINAFAGPGAGKTTSCLEIAEKLKKQGFVVEYVQEYAKELVWDNRTDLLNGSPENQFNILKEQLTRVDRLYGKVDFIVTDSPVLLNSTYLANDIPEYNIAVQELYNHFDNFNYFVDRDISKFEVEGRIHNLEQSLKIDEELKNTLSNLNLEYVICNHNTIDNVVNDVIQYQNVKTTALDNRTTEPTRRQQRYSKEDNERIISDIKSNISIVDYAQQIGFTVKRVGNYYTLKEHDSVRIEPSRNVFVQNSTGIKGSIIDFVMHFENLDKAAAINQLAKYINADTSILSTPNHNYPQFSAERSDNVPLILPNKAKTMKNVFAYLINTRKIDSKIVNQWVKNKNLYQDTHNNCVFVTYDNNGKANFVSQKGTNTSKPFRADIKGSDYNCCHFINNNAKSLIVCEAVIDLMSVQTILKANGRDINNYNYLSLNGSTKVNAINNALAQSTTESVVIAVDNDKAGKIASEALKSIISEYDEKNIKVIDYLPKNEKDWNAELVSNVQRENTALSQSNSKQKLSDKIEDCQNKANEHNKMIDNNKSQSLAQKRNVPDL